MVDESVNVTKRVLEQDEFEVGDAEKHAKKKADDIEKGISPNQYKQVRDQTFSKVEELERSIDNDLDDLIEALEDYEKLMDDEEFQQDCRDGFVDVEAFDKARQVVEPTQDIIPLFTLVKEMLQKFSDQQDKMIDIQQLAQDEGRIKEYIDTTADWQEKKFDRMIESFEDYIDRRDEKLEDRDKRLEELKEELNSIKKTNAKYNDELSQSLNNLADAIQGLGQGSGRPRGGSGRPRQDGGVQQDSRQMRTSPAGNGGTGSSRSGNGKVSENRFEDKPDLGDFDLTDEEKKLIRLFWEHKREILVEDSGFTQNDLADEVGYAKSTVSGKLNEFEERGIISRDVHI